MRALVGAVLAGHLIACQHYCRLCLCATAAGYDSQFTMAATLLLG